MNTRKYSFYILLFLLFGCNNTQKVTNNNIIVELHNQKRTEEKLEPLMLNLELCKYAKKHTDWMALKNRLSHSNMSDLAEAAKTDLVGENIAWGQEDEKEVFNSWMHSSGHKRNILNSKYKQVGCGMTKDKNGKSYWCVVFSGN